MSVLSHHANGRSSHELSPQDRAVAARTASQHLTAASAATRSLLLRLFAEEIQTHTDDILAINAEDVDALPVDADKAIRSRLSVSHSKLSAVCDGIMSLSMSDDPIGHVQLTRELADGLILQKVSVPIGVVLIIFESRPDVYPQLVALAVRTGNAVLLKGGSESRRTLHLLHELYAAAVVKTAAQLSDVTADDLLALVSLLPDRSAVQSLLSLTDYIDLIIPRGSSELVRTIQSQTSIPVMGHSEGVCHIYIDETHDEAVSTAVCIDAKCDYPAACNAVECILIHPSLCDTHNNTNNSEADRLITALQSNGVTVYTGPVAVTSQKFPHLQKASSLHHEYGSLHVTIEIVNTLIDAINFINTNSSHHTDAIITSNKSSADQFTRLVDSAVVLVNASTRFCDGYRFGMGCEVGISTGRLHARGPVGLDGLCTYKWIVQSSSTDGHTVTQHNQGKWKYKFKDLTQT